MATLLKMNMPMEEADDMAGKVKDKKVSELFANMEKMDIQLERRKTKEALEEAIKSGIELCQEFGASRETATMKVCEKYRLTLEEGNRKVHQYWK